MSLADLFEGDESVPAVGAGRRSAGWFASVQVVPVAVVAAIAMTIPVLAYYGQIPVTLSLGEAGPVAAWLAVAAGWGVGLLGAGAGLAAAAVARRFGWVVVIGLVTLGLGGVAVSQHADPAVSARAYFSMHADAFSEIRAVAVVHQARTAAAVAAEDVDAAITEVRLPSELREHSITGNLAALGDGVYLLPVSPGLGDGFLLAPDGLPQARIGDLSELGGGWYWLTEASG